jgi:hypothetical protein
MIIEGKEMVFISTTLKQENTMYTKEKNKLTPNQKKEQGHFTVLFRSPLDDDRRVFRSNDSGLVSMVIELLEVEQRDIGLWGRDHHGFEKQKLIDKIEERGSRVLRDQYPDMKDNCLEGLTYGGYKLSQ